MPPSTRRTLLARVATLSTVVLAGCTGETSDEPTGRTPPAADDTTAGADDPTVGTTTETPVFEHLSTDGMVADCPMPDYASHATTPVPYPTPAAPEDAGAAIDLVTDIEAAYLDNWVVLNYDPLPTPTEPEVQYPAVSASYDARTVRQHETGVVVHLQYERRVAGDLEGTYTVSYYLTPSSVARAETPGYHRPGPHPTEEGVLLTCW